jgi:hypothetical protein
MDDSIMQIKKIVSGGQTGADRAGLDFAIEYDIDHSGWVPEGRLAEDGPVSLRYNLQELAGGNYRRRTEKNVEDSDGTLIVSRGDLTGGSLLTLEFARKYARPCLHINLEKIIVFDAAIDVYEWLKGHDIKVLNVAGPRASKDSQIYELMWNLLEMVLHMDTISSAMPKVDGPFDENQEQMRTNKDRFPQSVEEAVEELLKQLTAKTKSRVASRPQSDLEGLRHLIGSDIARQLGLDLENTALIESCRNHAGKDIVSVSEAVNIIIKKLWERLRQMGQLRIAK